MLATWGTSTGINPATLFAAGEQGAWYDPSDYSTLFQDSTGTTPVTAVEQAVGLILDKSKGLVLGPELVTNGDFSSGTGWTTGGGWAIGSGVATATSTSTTLVGSSYPVVGGRGYRVEFDVVTITGGTLFVRVGQGTAQTFTTTGRKTCILYSTDTTGIEFYGGTVSCSIDNISVRELAGNHAIQPTSASRPTLRARYNLLTYSEQFDNAAWTKTNLNTTGTPAYVNVAVAPDGTTTADKLIANTTSGLHFYRQNIATLAGSYTMSVYAKAAEYTGLWLSMDGGSNYGLFTLTGAGTATATIGTATITAVGNGWYLCTHTATRVAGTAVLFFAAANPPGTLSFAGNDSDGILLWGADFRAANDIASGIPSYQRIAAATDYDTVGFPVYLAFDGSDDSLLTASVNFTGTDKMTVFSGLSKLSDAAQGAVVELSATIASNNGTFLLAAPNSAAANYNFSSKGTTQVDNTVTTYTAPITNVVTGQGDISAPSNVIRVNGAQVGSVSTTQGTGNFGNYPLYIGRRNNATIPFNGRIYSLIVRGAASNSTQIAQTERWVAAKTPLGTL